MGAICVLRRIAAYCCWRAGWERRGRLPGVAGYNSRKVAMPVLVHYEDSLLRRHPLHLFIIWDQENCSSC